MKQITGISKHTSHAAYACTYGAECACMHVRTHARTDRTECVRPAMFKVSPQTQRRCAGKRAPHVTERAHVCVVCVSVCICDRIQAYICIKCARNVASARNRYGEPVSIELIASARARSLNMNTHSDAASVLRMADGRGSPNDGHSVRN